MQLPATLAAHGPIDEFTFVVHPGGAGRGPRLLDCIREQIHLELVERPAFRSGAIVQRYRSVA